MLFYNKNFAASSRFFIIKNFASSPRFFIIKTSPPRRLAALFYNKKLTSPVKCYN